VPADRRAVIAAICDERLRFLKSLKTWDVFGKGWGRRVAEVRTAALAMADAREAKRRAPAKAAAMVVAAGGAAAATQQAGLSLVVIIGVAVIVALAAALVIHLVANKG
jgi:lysozyme family protein